MVASLKEFATTCSQDLSLFVDATAPATNRLCSATEKCKTISNALEILPDIISCTITINVAKGLYQEPIRIEDKVIRRSGKFIINGALPGADGFSETILKNDVTASRNEDRRRGFVIFGLTSGVSASIPVFELKNISLQLNPATDPKDGITYGFVAQSSNFKLENVKISGFDSAIFAPTLSSVIVKNLVVENAKSGLYARNPTNVVLAGDISFNGADKSDPLSVGIQFDSPSLLNMGRVDDPLVSLKIDNFYQGMRLNGAIANSRGGEDFAIQNVHHGISMFESSALRLPNLATATPVEISVKNFTGTGILLANSSITDGESTNWAAIVPSASHSLKLRDLQMPL